jgi:ribosomal-protein-alanine N-acetyltransferase
MFFSYMSSKHQISFREPNKEDIPFYLDIRNNFDLQLLLCVSNPTIQTIGDVEMWLKRKGHEENLLFTTIIDNMTKRFLGYLQIKDIDKSLKVGTVGLCLHPANKGRGYGTQSLSLLHDYVQSSTELRKLYGKLLATNTPSINMLKKSGYSIRSLENEYFEQSGVRYPLCECELHLPPRVSE